VEWINTSDKAGRRFKEYYPYTIAKHNGDKYRSVGFEYDNASRRTMWLDPTNGRTCADTSGWPDGIEPEEEDDCVLEAK